MTGNQREEPKKQKKRTLESHTKRMVKLGGAVGRLQAEGLRIVADNAQEKLDEAVADLNRRHNSLNTTANAANTTANKALTEANGANRTADEAKSTAEQATSTADEAKNQATELARSMEEVKETIEGLKPVADALTLEVTETDEEGGAKKVQLKGAKVLEHLKGLVQNLETVFTELQETVSTIEDTADAYSRVFTAVLEKAGLSSAEDIEDRVDSITEVLENARKEKAKTADGDAREEIGDRAEEAISEILAQEGED